MDQKDDVPTPPESAPPESLSDTAPDASTAAAPRLTRRDFMDVLGRTTLVGAAFSVSLVGAGCGSGSSNDSIRRAYTGLYTGFIQGIGATGSANFDFEALAGNLLRIFFNIEDPTRAKTRAFESLELNTTFNPNTGAFDATGTLPSGTPVRVFGTLPNPGSPTRSTLFRLEYINETYTGSILFDGVYGYDDYDDYFGYDDYYDDYYDDSVFFFNGDVDLRGGEAFVSFGANEQGRATGGTQIYDPSRAKATVTVTRGGKTRKATYVALLNGSYNLNSRQFNLTGVIGTGQTVRVSGTAAQNDSSFPFTLNYDGQNFTGSMTRFGDYGFDDYFYDDFYFDDYDGY